MNFYVTLDHVNLDIKMWVPWGLCLYKVIDLKSRRVNIG